MIMEPPTIEKKVTAREKPKRMARTLKSSQLERAAESNTLSGTGTTRTLRDNPVFIRTKLVMSYVLACVTHFTHPDSKMVVVETRGRVIPRAVDTIELLRRSFANDFKLNRIDIHTKKPRENRDENRMF